MVVFSERTGPSGDHTFIDVRSFAAAAMTDQNSLTEQAALSQIVHMGYHITDLPNDIFMTLLSVSGRDDHEAWSRR